MVLIQVTRSQLITIYVAENELHQLAMLSILIHWMGGKLKLIADTPHLQPQRKRVMMLHLLARMI
jgi:hypothetical protein